MYTCEKDRDAGEAFCGSLVVMVSGDCSCLLLGLDVPRAGWDSCS